MTLSFDFGVGSGQARIPSANCSNDADLLEKKYSSPTEKAKLFK